jgi:hypothetical protein
MSTPAGIIPKQKNPFRISVNLLAQNRGFDSTEEFFQEECQDSVMPARCAEECEVEPDGTCEHGCPSPLLALGMI